jgi:hypothetical protein
MNRYKGYLTGINPFYNPLADEDKGKGLANIMAVDDV